MQVAFCNCVSVKQLNDCQQISGWLTHLKRWLSFSAHSKHFPLFLACCLCVCYLEQQLLPLVSSEQQSPLWCFHVLVLCICKREYRFSVFLFSFFSEMFVRTVEAQAESAWVHIALNIVSAALALKEESIVPKDTEALCWELAVPSWLHRSCSVQAGMWQLKRGTLISQMKKV